METKGTIELGNEDSTQQSNTDNNNLQRDSAGLTVTDTYKPKLDSCDMSLNNDDVQPQREVAAEEPLSSNTASPQSPPSSLNPVQASDGVISNEKHNEKDGGDTLTEVSADEESPENDGGGGTVGNGAPTAIVSSSKKNRPQYKYDPDKITLRFLFANRDGLAVTVECKPSDTIGEVKGALLSVWPEDMPVKVTELGGDNLRLICMGKGYLMPDTRTLQDCQVPVFKTHPTPINVSIKPTVGSGADDDKNSKKNKKDGSSDGAGGGAGSSSNSPSVGASGSSAAGSQGCCVIL